MKTAYELAMERLEAASGPTRRLSDDEKAALAEIDKKYDAQVAALRIDSDAKKATASSYAALQELQEELARELAAIEDRRTRDKDAIWGES
jgi:methenyltetrahydromethanopterin cyclohydrolase